MTDTIGMWIFCLMGMGIMVYFREILAFILGLGI